MLARLSPRYKQIVLLAALTILVLLVLFGELPDTNLFWREAQNSGHTILFILISVLILLLLQNTAEFLRRAPLKHYTTACLLGLFIGVVTEMVQLMMHSDASMVDVARDIAGVIVGMGLYASVDPDLRPYWLKSRGELRVGVAMLSFCVFTVSMAPLAVLSAAYVQREDAFPVVVDLTANWVKPFLRLKNATVSPGIDNEVAINGVSRFVRVDFERGIYPGVSVVETSPDWSAYKVLTVAIYSKLSQPLDLVLRVNDDQHNNDYADRFNRGLTVNKGLNHFRILLQDIKTAPLNREMNMVRMKEITIFSVRPDDELYFYLGDIYLE
jgi:VanZ family protein